jgi:hypothetical protein
MLKEGLSETWPYDERLPSVAQSSARYPLWRKGIAPGPLGATEAVVWQGVRRSFFPIGGKESCDGSHRN